MRQNVRRRLNLAELPEDKPRPLALKYDKKPRARTECFKDQDQTLLPPTPSPKKRIGTTAKSTLAEKGAPRMLDRRAGLRNKGSAISESHMKTSSRQPITQVKEFKFASETRSRRKTGTEDGSRRQDKVSSIDKENEMDEGDQCVNTRMKAREIGAASIIAWGETRGRYLDD